MPSTLTICTPEYTTVPFFSFVVVDVLVVVVRVVVVVVVVDVVVVVLVHLVQVENEGTRGRMVESMRV